MRLSYRNLKFRLSQRGLMPSGKLALVAWYLLVLDLALFVVQKVLDAFKSSYGASLGGWVSFLSFVVILLFAVLAFRWLKKKLLWRLRNRLIVTYVFIGVIPVVLLVAMAAATIYLFSGQFANFIVTSEIGSQLRSMGAVNSATRMWSSSLSCHGEASYSQCGFLRDWFGPARAGVAARPSV